MKILFATAEFSPLVRVGGLAEATAGLVSALRDAGIDVEVVVPDYFKTDLGSEQIIDLDLPTWAGPGRARSGHAEGIGQVTLVEVPNIVRPNPYVDVDGEAWPDNADRFFAFSAAIGALAEIRNPDIVHVNDWHTAASLGFLSEDVPSVLTIHTLGYQGWTSGGWLDRIPRRADAFEAYGGTNPMAGGIQLADRVVAVSPTYADEIRRPETGAGLHDQLSALGPRLVGIRNGIDTSMWDPSTDPHIARTYDVTDMSGKEACRADLLDIVGWEDTKAPIAGIVTRLVGQKGIELVLEAVKYAATMPFRLVILGSGERGIADHVRHVAKEHPDALWFFDGYDNQLGHKIFAGADLLLMPSRFEPCGLAQMQAMEYGTIPVVTGVGGLRDTVFDADRYMRTGTGFVAASVDPTGVLDPLHRAVRAWKHQRRRVAIQKRGMSVDWSWREPAQHHIELYEELASQARKSSDR